MIEKELRWERYVQNKGAHCYYCGKADHVWVMSQHISDLTMQRSMWCAECDKEWVENYELVRISEEVT